MPNESGHTADLLITGGLVVTLDDSWSLIDDGAVALTDGEIVGIGTTAELESNYNAAERIDAGGHAIMRR